jgi:hypothetical protein
MVSVDTAWSSGATGIARHEAEAKCKRRCSNQFHGLLPFLSLIRRDAAVAHYANNMAFG